jgi:chloride channel protein, CIC family
VKITNHTNGIPISPELDHLAENKDEVKKSAVLKQRLIIISFLCIGVAVAISLIAKFLVTLINVVTNISFYGTFSLAFNSPSHNHLGLWVIVIPAIGGVIVGIMALYGSKAIRGHGIPEAMDIGQSKQNKTCHYFFKTYIIRHSYRHRRTVWRGRSNHRNRRCVRFDVGTNI